MTKEELKQEAEECMHNALYWLKLPISKENVEQGGSYILKLLEPREKRIEELEKENKVLAQNLEDTEILNKTYEKKHNDLKKENAELKADNAEWEKASDKWKNIYELTDNQLTKAKELLKRWLRLYNTNTVKGIIADTEKFLNSEGK